MRKRLDETEKDREQRLDETTRQRDKDAKDTDDAIDEMIKRNIEKHGP